MDAQKSERKTMSAGCIIALVVLAVGAMICVLSSISGRSSSGSSRSSAPGGQSSGADCPRAGTSLTITRRDGAELWVTSDADDDRTYGKAPWNAGLTATGRCVDEQGAVMAMIGTEEGWVFRSDVDW